MTNQKEEFQLLKEHFISESVSLVTALEKMDVDDIMMKSSRSQLALLQAQCSKSFTELYKCISALQLDTRIENT